MQIKSSLQALLRDESGFSSGEFALFVGMMFLAGGGFLYATASQFMGVFMPVHPFQF